MKKTAKRLGKDPGFDAVASAGRVGLGRVCLAQSEPQAADRWFGEVQRLWPTDWRGFYWSGCAAAHGGRFDQAEWCFTAAITRGAPQGRAHIQRAYVHARTGRDALALADLHSAAQQWPLTAAVREFAAVVALRAGQLPQADWHASALSTPVASAVRGAIAHRRGDARSALDEHEKALEGGLADPAILLQHGAAAYRVGDFDRAAVSWSRAPGGEGPAATARHARAVARLRAGDLTAAIPDLEAAAEQGFAVPLEAVRLHAAAAAIAAGETEEAALHLKAGAGERSAVFLGLLDFEAGETEAAAAAWRQSPGDPIARLGLALIALRAGEDASAELEGLMDSALPEAIWRAAYRAAGALHARGGDWESARDAFEASIAGISADIVAHDDAFGECLYRTGHFEDLLSRPENPWHIAALARLDPDADLPLGAGPAAREAAFGLRQAAYGAAAEGAWERAAKLLHRSDSGGEPGPATLVIDTVVSALGGRRRDALDRLAATERPAGARLAHTRALILLHGADDADLAERCIAAWAPLLEDEDYWDRWGRAAARRYGCAVPKRALEDMRGRLRRLIEDAALRAGATGSVDLMVREQAATALLAELGGLPIGGGVRISCGPMRIAELGLERRLSEFVLEHEFESTGDPLIQFSHIGLGLARASAEQPAEALKLALDTRCPDCRARHGGRARGGGDRPLLCDADCPEFDRRNPALAALPDKREELSDMAGALAADALLDLAMSAVAKRPMDVQEATTRWRHALAHAERNGERASVIEPMAATALGRAETLTRRRDLDGGIELLDAVLKLLRGDDRPHHDRIVTRLSYLYGQRGVQRANDGQDRSARRDLERAVALAPHQIAPRRNLGVMLQNGAAKRLNLDSTIPPSAADMLEAIDLLAGSSEQFQAGLRIQPNHPELRTRLAESQKLHSLISAILSGDVRRIRRSL
ncbi:CHAT domain-containing protein [Glycomyces rhizosphaerae]|uniref:Tetratricopeptide repeat protein n=1 Tax=Glycomyces rhizosphaerae TaxID=2054422 RepID=A0ABV7PWI3_9ACTN